MENTRSIFIEAIYARYADKLETMCMRYVSYNEEYRDLVDDSIQKTFIKAFECYEDLKTLDYIEGWIFKTCINRLTTALKTYRRRKKHHVPLELQTDLKLRPEQILDSINDFVNRVSNQELIERIFTALNSREREVAERYFIHGWSVEEIANHDQTTVGAVKAVLARLRAKARKIAQEEKNYFWIIPYLFFLMCAYRK